MMLVEKGCFYDDSSCLVTKFYSHGTLLVGVQILLCCLVLPAGETFLFTFGSKGHCYVERILDNRV